MTSLIRLLVLVCFIISHLLFPAPAYAQETSKPAPKILYVIEGQISAGLSGNPLSPSGEYKEIGERVTASLSKSALGTGGSVSVETNGDTYSVSHMSGMSDPGGLLAELLIPKDWMKYGYYPNDYSYGTGIKSKVKIYVRANSARRFSLIHIDLGTLDTSADGHHWLQASAAARSNEKQWRAVTGWTRDGVKINDSPGDFYSRRKILNQPVSCFRATTTFPEYPGVTYCLAYEGVTSTDAGQGNDLVYSVNMASSAQAAHSAKIRFTTRYVPKRKPGKKCRTSDDLTCGSNQEGLTVCPESGNLSLSFDDPVPTRGYPLSNTIHLNTQAIEFDRSMGNATFSYDIHIAKDVESNGDEFEDLHWILVDGDGTRMDYGPVTANPTPEPGVYGKLRRTEDGFELTDAGAPEAIAQAGNFHYRFDQEGKLLELIDPAGNRQTLSYNASGNLTQVFDQSSKRSLAFEYEGNRIARIIENGRGAITTLSYASGKLANIKLENGQGQVARSTAIAYNANGLPDTFVFDGDQKNAQKLTYALVPTVDSESTVPLVTGIGSGKERTTITYGLDPVDEINPFTQQAPEGITTTKVTNSKGGTTSYNFDEKGDLVWMGSPAVNQGQNPRAQTLMYNNNHQVRFISRGASLIATRFSYYPNGLLQEMNENGIIRRYSYNGVDLVKVEDALGTLLELGYTDPKLPHSPTTLKDGNGNLWSFAYNSFGQVTAMIPPEGSPQKPTTIEYWEDEVSPYYGYPKALIDGSGNKVTFDKYSSLGDLTTWSTPTNTTTADYDALHRPTKVTYKNGATQQWNYNGQFLASTVDELGNQYNYEFCVGCNALQKISGPLKWSLQWQRDDDHDVTGFIDARGQQTNYEYGLAKELAKVIYPDGSSLSYRYDRIGRVTEVTNARGIKETYEYDYGIGRLPYRFRYSDGTPTLSYTYNNDGTVKRIVQFGQPFEQYNYEYYPNRLLKSWSYDGQTVEYTY